MKLINFLVALTLIAGWPYPGRCECDCAEVMGQLIERVEHEYPGFKDVVRDPRAYEGFKTSLVESAAHPGRGDCFGILQEYVEGR